MKINCSTAIWYNLLVILIVTISGCNTFYELDVNNMQRTCFVTKIDSMVYEQRCPTINNIGDFGICKAIQAKGTYCIDIIENLLSQKQHEKAAKQLRACLGPPLRTNPVRIFSNLTARSKLELNRLFIMYYGEGDTYVGLEAKILDGNYKDDYVLLPYGNKGIGPSWFKLKIPDTEIIESIEVEDKFLKKVNCGEVINRASPQAPNQDNEAITIKLKWPYWF